MIKKMTSLLEVGGNDNLGTAVLKGAVKGYIQGTLAAGLGLGVLAVGCYMISNREESEEEDEIEFELDEDLEERTSNLLKDEVARLKTKVYQ